MEFPTHPLSWKVNSLKVCFDCRVLRSCNIHGNIHDSVAEMVDLRFL